MLRKLRLRQKNGFLIKKRMCNSVYKHGLVCMSETFFDSSPSRYIHPTRWLQFDQECKKD